MKKKEIKKPAKVDIDETIKEIDNEEIAEDFKDITAKPQTRFIQKIIVIIIFLAVFIRFYGTSRIVTKEYSIIESIKDYGGNDRVVICRFQKK